MRIIFLYQKDSHRVYFYNINEYLLLYIFIYKPYIYEIIPMVQRSLCTLYKQVKYLINSFHSFHLLILILKYIYEYVTYKYIIYRM